MGVKEGLVQRLTNPLPAFFDNIFVCYQKMGWKEGLGLGKSNQGRTDIISTDDDSQRTRQSGKITAEDDSKRIRQSGTITPDDDSQWTRQSGTITTDDDSKRMRQ